MAAQRPTSVGTRIRLSHPAIHVKGEMTMPDKGPGSKGGAKKPKGGKAAAASKNGKK